MKKRILALALCALLLAALLPSAPVSADDKLTFLAVNDLLPPELINVVVSYGGVTYVPYWLFTNYGLGFNYTFFAENSTAYLFTASRQLFFELPTGKTYDSMENEYGVSAIMWGGTVYLPLEFISSYFGSYSYGIIGSNEYGVILRVRNGSELLSDDIFFNAAISAMQRYYQMWSKGATPQQPSPEPPEQTEKPTREGDAVRLGLIGLPSEATLELLRDRDLRVCFFLRAEEIRSAPDLVRRIACEGHTIGVSSPEGDGRACEKAAALLWETARVRTVLAAMPEGAVQPDGMAVFPTAQQAPDAQPDAQPDAEEMAYSVTSRLELLAGDQTVLFPTGGADVAALRTLLSYLSEMEFSVLAIRETDGGGTPILP